MRDSAETSSLANEAYGIVRKRIVRGKVRLDDRLVLSNHNNHGLNPAGSSFFDRILDQWLAGYREHFFWNGLGGRKHARPETSRRDDRFADFFCTRHAQTIGAKGNEPE